MKPKKTVLIIDDHPLFREGLKSILVNNPSTRFEIIGEAGNAKEGLAKAKDLKPDLVLIDISLPDHNGIEATRSVRSLLSGAKVAVVSMYSKIDFVTEAFRAGATGYVVKESAAEKLIECLESISRGKFFIDPSLSHNVVEKLMKPWKREADVEDAGYRSLTPRERQVMKLLSEGIPPKQVAKKLFISPKTVENHRGKIMGKLELHSTIELVRYAAKLGLIDIESWKD